MTRPADNVTMRSMIEQKSLRALKADSHIQLDKRIENDALKGSRRRKYAWESFAKMGSRKSRPFSHKIILAIVVIAVVGLFTYFYYIQNVDSANSSILIDWRLKITFNDARTNTNYTLPAYIGTSSGAWSNHTLDAFGPPGYSPMSTRDTSSTIWIQSTEPAVFNFGDFFNVWGQEFNQGCVSYAGILESHGSTMAGTYCSSAAEPVIYDVKGNNLYDPTTDNVSEVSDLAVQMPSAGATLSSDSHILFISVGSSSVWNVNETVVYDSDGDRVYNPSTDPIIHPGANSTAGAALSSDLRLKFYDWNGNGKWDASVPPPVLSDGTTERCLGRGINLSNGKDWLIILWSGLYREVSGGCPPSGS